jgi:hypothetical protein
MVLQQLQEMLAGIYDLPVHYKVYDFLFTERERLPQTVRESRTDEQVLVLDEGGAAAVGLFLDAQLLERLAAANPIEALHAGNLSDYWTALEGVSHFIYLAWNAGHDRGVSLLELELQAEIDKYVSSWLLLREQDPERYPAELHRLLFAPGSTCGWPASAASSTAKPINTRRASAGGSSGNSPPKGRRCAARRWPS